jgi:hypothetical protein
MIIKVTRDILRDLMEKSHWVKSNMPYAVKIDEFNPTE